MSNLKLELWASDVMDEITYEHAVALDVAGWKIVRKDGDNHHLWPFYSKEAEYPCPGWCEDLSKLTPRKPDLHLVE